MPRMDPTMSTGRVSVRVLFSVHAFNLHVIPTVSMIYELGYINH
jgi:hypothetical protein